MRKNMVSVRGGGGADLKRAKPTRRAYSRSEVITVLKGLEKNMRTKIKARLNMKRPVIKTTKPHKIRITPGPQPPNGQ